MAVRDLDLVVPRGSLSGFIGPNGAGKTTTIRMIMSILFPDRGEISVLGHPSALEAKDRIGYLPEERGVYRKMKVGAFLRYLARLKGADAGDLNDRIRGWLDRVGLLDVERKPCEELSKGMQQKIQFVAAILHEPELLILDEPTSGLDPLMQQEFNTLIDETRASGRTVFLSSHVLPEVERLADRVGIVRQSRLVALEDVEALKGKALRHVELTFPVKIDPGPFQRLAGVRKLSASDDGLRLTLQVAGRVEEVIAEAARLSATDLVSHEAELEEIFLAHYGQALDDAS